MNYPPPGYGGAPSPGYGAVPPGGYGAPPPGGGFGAPPPMGPRTDMVAVSSVVSGVLGAACGLTALLSSFFSACCCFGSVGVITGGGLGLILSIVGLILGYMASGRIERAPQELSGKGLVKLGLASSGIGVLLSIVSVVIWVLATAGWIALNAMSSSGR